MAINFYVIKRAITQPGLIIGSEIESGSRQILAKKNEIETSIDLTWAGFIEGRGLGLGQGDRK